MLNRQRKKIAKEIEAVFERIHKGENAYSKGEFYNGEFFIRSDHALILLNENNEILVSFADHTRPSYAALYALLLTEIKNAPLFICHDYETDEKGSMIIEDADFSSTGELIWDDKKRYYNMLKQKVSHIVIKKTK